MKVMILGNRPNFSRVGVRTDAERARVRFLDQMFKYMFHHSKNAHKLINLPFGSLILVRKK